MLFVVAAILTQCFVVASSLCASSQLAMNIITSLSLRSALQRQPYITRLFAFSVFRCDGMKYDTKRFSVYNIFLIDVALAIGPGYEGWAGFDAYIGDDDVPMLYMASRLRAVCL